MSLNKNLRVKPYFNFLTNMKILNQPLIIGTSLGLVPLIVGIVFLYFTANFMKSTSIFPTSFD